MEAAGSSAQYVQSGITDIQLDSMTGDGQPGPCVQLTSVQVHHGIELLTSGLLGRGGAAFVFMGRWRKRFGEGLLAIKLPKDAFDTPAMVLQSFEYEARLLSTIRHPHVVQLHGYCLEPPHLCLIMELLPGSLEGLLYPPEMANSQTTISPGSQLAHAACSKPCSLPGSAAAHSSNSSAFVLEVVDGDGTPSVSPTIPTLVASPVATSSVDSGGTTSGAFRRSGQVPASPTTPSTSTRLRCISHSTPSGGTQQRLSMQAVLQIAADVAAALAYLHERQVTGVIGWISESAAAHQDMRDGSAQTAKVVHRDLKPANVLINSNGLAKLCDFGLARQNPTTTLNTMHIHAGTLAYMAPELLLLSATKPTNRVDIYSLGIMMWELVARRRPWQNLNHTQLASAVVLGQRPLIQFEESPMPSASSHMDSSGLSPAGTHQLASSWPKKLAVAPVDWSHVPADFSACPEYLDVIRDCWHQRDLRRPSAAEVLRRLQAILASKMQ